MESDLLDLERDLTDADDLLRRAEDFAAECRSESDGQWKEISFAFVQVFVARNCLRAAIEALVPLFKEERAIQDHLEDLADANRM